MPGRSITTNPLHLGAPMNALKNAAHLVLLALWAVAGALFTLKVVFGASPALMPAFLFWAWFAGFAAVTSFIVGQFKGPLSAIGTHAAAFFVLHLVPKVLPFSILRLGLDLLAGNS
jgi:hypothetical protein